MKSAVEIVRTSFAGAAESVGRLDAVAPPYVPAETTTCVGRLMYSPESLVMDE
jgi:hypothetical protein